MHMAVVGGVQLHHQLADLRVACPSQKDKVVQPAQVSFGKETWACSAQSGTLCGGGPSNLLRAVRLVGAPKHRRHLGRLQTF